MPKIPEHRRMTVGQVIGKDWEKGDWRPIVGTTMEGLLNKAGNNNFVAEKNHTLVGLDSKRASSFPKSYGKIQVTSSYLKHPDKDYWRMFRSDEILKFLNIPEWYLFPEFMGEGDRVKLIGQSISGNVVKAIGVEASVAYMGSKYKKLRSADGSGSKEIPVQMFQLTEQGQLAFQFEDVHAS